MARVPSVAAAHVGTQIARARTNYTMTHDQLAAATGIDSSNIRSYESGRALPGIHSLMRIATALGLPPGYFLDGLTLDMFDGGVRRAS